MEYTKNEVRQMNFSELCEIVHWDEALELQKISRALHHLDEVACMTELTQRQLKRIENLERKANEITKKYGKIAYHQGDPRGWSLYICDPSDRIESEYTKGIAVCSF